MARVSFCLDQPCRTSSCYSAGFSDDSPSGEATGVRLSAGFVSNAGPPLP